MTLAEKLRFLADRVEDGKEFYIMYSEKKIRTDYEGFTEDYDIQELKEITVSLKPQWEFTDDEKAILRNLPDEFQWIARDKDRNELCAYTSEPVKASNQHWVYEDGGMADLNIFRSIFQSIQWSDDEPCEFRRYIR